MKRSPWRWVTLVAVVLAVAGGGLWYAFRPAAPTPYNHAEHLPEQIAEPVWMGTVNASVRQSYVFAAHNHDLLSQIPCWCSCEEIHKNNAECYFKFDENNAVVAYDDHAYGCGVCVDITTAVIKDLDRGKSLAEIRKAIDAEYQGQGLPPTPTPPVSAS